LCKPAHDFLPVKKEQYYWLNPASLWRSPPDHSGVLSQHRENLQAQTEVISVVNNSFSPLEAAQAAWLQELSALKTIPGMAITAISHTPSPVTLTPYTASTSTSTSNSSPSLLSPSWASGSPSSSLLFLSPVGATGKNSTWRALKTTPIHLTFDDVDNDNSTTSGSTSINKNLPAH